MTTTLPVDAPAPKARNSSAASKDLLVSITTIKTVFLLEAGFNVAKDLKGKVPVRLGKYSFNAVFDIYSTVTVHDKAAALAQAIAIQSTTDKENESKRRVAKINAGRRNAAKAVETSKSTETLITLADELAYWSNKLAQATKEINDIKVRLASTLPKPKAK
jgi:hypothetical protein